MLFLFGFIVKVAFEVMLILDLKFQEVFFDDIE